MAVAIFQGNYSDTVFNRIDRLNLYILGTVPGYVLPGTTILGNYWSSIPKWPITILITKFFYCNQLLIIK